ncbi:MAG TPA: 3-phosphoshikimate 1-carboxyvinyltransferase [Thermoanaerobaculia bacterium]|nr:3-phosphoshikimate 1-carboxyvinyltransferase [Thermoanaerobaculia bacterium]
MTDFIAVPPAREVRGTVAVPPSKSGTNRALVLAALSETPVEIESPLESEDTRALAGCLAAMGAVLRPSARGLVVHGPLSGSADLETVLDAGESGTAARFLTALATATPGRFVVTGASRLRERPIGELAAALRSLGASIDTEAKTGGFPVRIRGGSLRSGRVAVDASRSSQFLSALLLAAPAVAGGLEISAASEIASAPYVGTTLETLRAFGHEVSGALRERGFVRVARGSAGVARYAVPGDYSSAIPLLASAGAAGGEVLLTGLAWPSADADAGALPVLERLGVEITGGPAGVRARRSGPLAAVSVAATDFPDSVPVLACLASLAPGESRFDGIGHLRVKESDRIASIADLLAAAGVEASARDNSLVVKGPARSRPGGGTVRLPTFDDHRIAMAGALLSLALPGMLVENPGCVAKSYPRFFRDLEKLAVRDA